MNWPVITLIALTLGVATAALWLAVVDIRADRAHARWMRRNDVRRRRTRIEVAGIGRGYRGMGLDGRADHPGALRKRTGP